MMTPDGLTALQDFYDLLTKVVVKNPHDVPNSERRFEIMARARMAIDLLGNHLVSEEDEPDLAVCWMAIRDLVAWATFELPMRLVVRTVDSPRFKDLRQECTSLVQSTGLHIEQQPDWRNLALRLYKTVRNSWRVEDVQIEGPALTFLETRYQDEQ